MSRVGIVGQRVKALIQRRMISIARWLDPGLGESSPVWTDFVSGMKLNFAILRGDGAIRMCGLQDYTILPDGDVRLNTAYDVDKLAMLSQALAGEIRGRRVLDIGSNNGLFAFQSLRWGAAHATGWDTRRDFVYLCSTMAGALNCASHATFEVRDFWSEPVECDVIFVFGLIHHLALAERKGLNAVLTHLSKFPTQLFCIEWVGSEDLSVRKLTERVGEPLDRIAYSEERFVELSRGLLGDVRRLGSVRHHRYPPKETDRSLFVISRT